MDEFYQRKLFLKKKFTFKENGIDIEFKDNDGEFSLFIPFLNIGEREDVRIFTKKKLGILRFGAALSGLTVIKAFALQANMRSFLAAIATAAIIGIVFYGYYYFTYLKYYAVPLKSGKYFQVLCNSPSAYEADEFLDEIYKRRDDYLAQYEYLATQHVYMDDEAEDDDE